MRSNKPKKDCYYKPQVERLEIVPCHCECLIQELAQHVMLNYQEEEHSVVLLQGGTNPQHHFGLLHVTHGPQCTNTKESLEPQVRWFQSEDELLDYLTQPGHPVPTGVQCQFETALLSLLENRRLTHLASSKPTPTTRDSHSGRPV